MGAGASTPTVAAKTTIPRTAKPVNSRMKTELSFSSSMSTKRECKAQTCPHYACSDAYTITSHTNTQISRSDHFCALHLRMSSLLEYKSLHTNGLGNAGVLETVADAVQLVSGARGIGEVLEIAMDVVSSFSIEGLFGNQPSALIGIGSERYRYTPVGMPLASPASAVASYVIYKSMPIFREKGFVLDSQIWTTWISLQWDASTLLRPLLTNPVEKIPGMFVTAGMAGLAAFQGARGNCERTAYLRVVLMGHSLGACLVYHVLSRRDSKVGFGEDEGSVRERKIESAILLGSVCPYKRIGGDGRDGWVDASEAVSRNIINLFSVKDEVLNALGKMNGVINGRSTKREKIINVQCDEVCGHFDWKPSVATNSFFQISSKLYYNYESN
ncbi:hypothetical protein BCR33DRAFT_725098, partial [Rhizoclosmatium globosum]